MQILEDDQGSAIRTNAIFKDNILKNKIITKKSIMNKMSKS